MARLTLSAALLAAVLGGCASEPDGDATAVAYEITPLPKNYKHIVTDYLKPRLKDRAIDKVGDAYQDSCRVSEKSTYYGWAVPVYYSAKKPVRRAAPQEIIWVNHNSVQMVSKYETDYCSKT